MNELTKRQQEIVEKAIEIIAEEGFHKLTTKNLAEKVGFSEPALYRHFKDKQEIILAVVKTIEINMLKLAENLDLSKKAKEIFFNLTCLITSYLKKVKGVTILIMSESSLENDDIVRDAMYSFYLKMLKYVSNILSKKKKEGEVKKEIDEKIAAQVFLGILQSMVLKYFLSGKEIEIDENCNEIVKIFLEGVLV